MVRDPSGYVSVFLIFLVQNNSFLDMMTANVNVSTEEAKRRDLKVGDFVRFWFNPQQQKWDIMF